MQTHHTSALSRLTLFTTLHYRRSLLLITLLLLLGGGLWVSQRAQAARSARGPARPASAVVAAHAWPGRAAPTLAPIAPAAVFATITVNSAADGHVHVAKVKR